MMRDMFLPELCLSHHMIAVRAYDYLSACAAGEMILAQQQEEVEADLAACVYYCMEFDQVTASRMAPEPITGI